MLVSRSSTSLLLAGLLALGAGCGDGTSASDAAVGLDARAIGQDVGSTEDTGRDLPDSRLELPDGDLSMVDADLFDRDSGLFDRDSALFDRDSAICGPMDARGEGACDLALGIVWNGTACVSISGCSCVGTECADLFRTDAACRLRYAACLGAGGTFACGPMRMCSLEGEYCNVANIGPAVRYTCEPLPAACGSSVSCASCFPTPGGAICSGDASTGLTLDDGRG